MRHIRLNFLVNKALSESTRMMPVIWNFLIKAGFFTLLLTFLPFNPQAQALNNCRFALSSIEDLADSKSDLEPTRVQQIMANVLITNTPVLRYDTFREVFIEVIKKLNPIIEENPLVTMGVTTHWIGSRSDRAFLKSYYTDLDPRLKRHVAAMVWEQLVSKWKDTPDSSDTVSDVQPQTIKKILNLIEADADLHQAAIDVVQISIPQVVSRSNAFLLLAPEKFARRRTEKAVEKTAVPNHTEKQFFTEVVLNPKILEILDARVESREAKKGILLKVLALENKVLFGRGYLTAFIQAFEGNFQDFIKDFNKFTSPDLMVLAGHTWENLGNDFLTQDWDNKSDQRLLLSFIRSEDTLKAFDMDREEFIQTSRLIYEINQRPQIKELVIELISTRLKTTADFAQKYSMAQLKTTPHLVVMTKGQSNVAFAATMGPVMAGFGTSIFELLHTLSPNMSQATTVHDLIPFGIGLVTTPVTTAIAKKINRRAKENAVPNFKKYLKENLQTLVNANDIPEEEE